ncbi:MAG: hypothetical protein NVS9B6_17430 [Candidatus Limnocylindrales bacterium]
MTALVIGRTGNVPTTPVSVASAPSGERQLFLTSPTGASIGATLRLPTVDAGVRVPAVLIVPAPWAADRDGRQRELGLVNSPYKVLAESLALRGIASLRYDQRGIGETRLGDVAGLGGFPPLALDAVSAFAALHARPEIDGARIGVMGHGAGGFAALSLAGSDHPPRAVVLVSAPGRPLVNDLRIHLSEHVLPAYGDRAGALLTAFDRAAAELRDGGPLTEPLDPAIAPYFPAAHRDLLRDLFRIDPADFAKPVKIPTLIFSGAQDREIPADDAGLLAAALGGSSERIVGPATGHDLERRPIPTGDASHDATMARTSVPDTDTASIERIADWIAAALRGQTP